MGKDKGEWRLTKVKLNMKGIREMMKSPEMQEILQEEGDRIADTAGEGYAVRVHNAKYVAIANVYADTPEAKRDNLEHNTLLKAVGPAHIVSIKKTKGGSKKKEK